MKTFEPYPYQQHCIDVVLNNPACALWLEMGLGKTSIVLSAVEELIYKRWELSKVLVVAPKKVSEATWQREVAKWDNLSHLRCSTVLGTEKQRIKALNEDADIYIINRDNVQWLVRHYMNAWPFDGLVLDEASSFKNPKAKRFEMLAAVRPRVKKVIELTGTPRPKDHLDLWSQVYLLDEGARLGRKYTHYRDRYFKTGRMITPYVFEYKLRPGAEQEINEKLSDVCVSMKAADYLELPDMIVHDVPVVLDPKARKCYDAMESTHVLSIEDDDVLDAATAAVLRMKLLQLGNGAVYDEDRAVVHLHDCKLQAFLELIEGLGEQSALVFYSFKHDIPRIMDALKKNYPDKVVRLFDGAQDEKDWNAGKVDVLLAHPASCAFGLNIQDGGHHIIWFGLPDSLELYMQANARLHRNGQQHPVLVHRLIVTDSADEDVVSGLEAKDKCQERLLEAMRARLGKKYSHWKK